MPRDFTYLRHNLKDMSTKHNLYGSKPYNGAFLTPIYHRCKLWLFNFNMNYNIFEGKCSNCDTILHCI